MDYYPRLFPGDEESSAHDHHSHGDHDEHTPCIGHNHVYTFEKALEKGVNRKRP